MTKKKSTVKRRRPMTEAEKISLLTKSVLELNKKIDRLSNKTPSPHAYHGTIWTEEMDSRLGDLFDRHKEFTLASLAKLFGRTRWSIFMRLVKLGKVTESNCYLLWAKSLTVDERTSFKKSYPRPTDSDRYRDFGAGYGHDD